MDLVTRDQAIADFPDLAHMFDIATAARERAYAPYSHYQVGCALLTSDGEVFAGCNVENASYGGTICAERSAVVSAVGAGHISIRACLTISPATPTGSCCGICRQVLSEFGPSMLIFNASSVTELVRRSRMEEMLPGAFDGAALKSRAP